VPNVWPDARSRTPSRCRRRRCEPRPLLVEHAERRRVEVPGDHEVRVASCLRHDEGRLATSHDRVALEEVEIPIVQRSEQTLPRGGEVHDDQVHLRERSGDGFDTG